MTEEHDHTHYHGVDKAEESISVSEAVKIMLENITPVKQETIGALKSNNRVLFEDIISPTNLPKRARSTRDGYAVNIPQDVDSGSSFNIIGSVRIGAIPKLSVRSGEAVRIATGSYMPNGANGVVMVEYAEVQNQTLRVNRAIKVHENVLNPGEDVSDGQPLLSKGARIHPQHIALFSMLGIRKVKVYSRPKIAFFSTGDELVDASKPTKSAATRIYDATRPFLASMISNLGCIPIDLGIARDKFAQTEAKMVRGLKYDALVLSAGSSVGERDYVTSAATSIDGVKILVHGVAMRPSSPTGIASYKGKPLLLLPGFPTSAIISFFVFARPAILRLSGVSNVQPITIKARLAEDYVGKPGVTHFVRVKVTREDGEYRAVITRPTDAQYSSWLSTANCVAVIGEKGIAKRDEIVDVFMIGEIL
jgi:molybdenum cofactor synthesis domain-containing protein